MNSDSGSDDCVGGEGGVPITLSGICFGMLSASCQICRDGASFIGDVIWPFGNWNETDLRDGEEDESLLMMLDLLSDGDPVEVFGGTVACWK